LRRVFAFLKVNERYGDFATVDRGPVVRASERRARRVCVLAVRGN
jgi:hypothetical protein